MDQATSAASGLAALLAERLVRYDELQPCTTAFIDTRTPGSSKKENFTIIGPGVAENPDQHVHINIPHGFNIGGARQPPGCINSQHSHETAEVFVIHSGTWAFYLGPEREDGSVILNAGDTISIPIHVFRGFENVGDDVGFMFAVLGGNDSGHVTWSPYVFDNAKEYGLILLEDGSLVDTTKGETIPDGKSAMPATTAADVAALRRLHARDMADCVVTRAQIEHGNSSSLADLHEYPIIGTDSPEEKLPAGKMSWAHGFHLRHIRIDAGGASKTHQRHEEEVIMMQSGSMTIRLADSDVELGPGDVMTVPIDMPRSFANTSDAPAEAYFVRGGDQPRAATFTA
jgi:mannose-6-phosphate isomerase-like protein (cupin superfamily)